MQPLGASSMPALTGAVTNTAGAVATALAAPYVTRTCEMVIGGTGASNVLQAGDDTIANGSCYNGTGVTETITGVYCLGDAGTAVTVTPIYHGGSAILTGSVTCGNNVYSTSFTIASASLAAAASIDPGMGGTLTSTHDIHVVIKYTVPAS